MPYSESGIDHVEELKAARLRRAIRVKKNGHKFKTMGSKPTASKIVMFVGRSNTSTFSRDDELQKCETSNRKEEHGLVYTMDGWNVDHDTDLILVCHFYAQGKRLCRPGRANHLWVEYSHDCLCGKLTLKAENLNQSTILCQRIETDEGQVIYGAIRPIQMVRK